MAFPISQKVVCVHGHFPAAVFEHFDRVPQENGTYTVSEIIWCREYVTDRPGFSVRLAELPPIMPGTGFFSLWRFRWLADEKTLRCRNKESAQPAARRLNVEPKPQKHSLSP
ncbi:MAG: hypothetical protein NTX35_23000 [Verrucomicrobia bacterium]|nr:hypothetical protein [Verrucomicrobiota bacterium]